MEENYSESVGGGVCLPDKIQRMKLKSWISEDYTQHDDETNDYIQDRNRQKYKHINRAVRKRYREGKYS